jgi:hypothetical protein
VSHGRQGISWIHINDMSRLITRAIANDAMEGAYKATAAAEHRRYVERREALWQELVPAPADLGIDFFWARLLPYQSRLQPGADGDFILELRNPSDAPTTFTARLACTTAVTVEPETLSITLEPGIKDSVACRLRVADDAPDDPRRRHLITVSIDTDGKPHGPITEALLVVESAPG